MKIPHQLVAAIVVASFLPLMQADDKSPGWHLIVGGDAGRTAVRLADGQVSEVKLGGGERATSDINPVAATRTVSHVLSPDGQRLLYQMSRGDTIHDNFIAMADSNGKNYRTIASQGNTIYPAWSVDGRQIAYLSQRPARDGPWHAYRMTVATGDETQLSREPVSSTVRPSFAADGQVIFAIDRGRTGKLPVMDLVNSDGVTATTLVSKNYVIASSTSPDGQQLAIVVPNELTLRNLKTDAVQKFPVKDANPNWHVTFHHLLWRPDNRALAVNFGFLGGREVGARIEGEDHVAVLSLEQPKPTFTTYRMGESTILYAWITDADMQRKK